MPTLSTPPTVKAAPLVSDDVFVFGLPFWNASYEDVRGWCGAALSDDCSVAKVLVFANAHTLNQTRSNVEFREAIAKADVRINDGSGFRIASRMRGVETRENLNGTDLVPRLLGDALDPIRVFVYGATEESNRGASEAIERRFPMVEVVGRLNGYAPTDEAVATIRDAKADLVLVALGHPRQELFCIDHRDHLNAKLLLPVGGLVDFLSETKPRAPWVFRRFGMEWAYRLAIEPRRMFARYVFGNPLFLIRSAVSARRDRSSALGPVADSDSRRIFS